MAHAWLSGALLGAALATLVGCQSTAAQRRQLNSRNPLDRAAAVVRLAEAGDRESVHKLVDLLEDPDAAVRLVAIVGLRRLTGDDRGFVYYAAETKRAAAVERWREALRAGTVRVSARP